MRILAVILTLASVSAWAAQSPPARQRVIDFDGDLVEGINKRPLDSLVHVGERDGRRKKHLYHKRSSFRSETTQTLREMEYRR